MILDLQSTLIVDLQSTLVRVWTNFEHADASSGPQNKKGFFGMGSLPSKWPSSESGSGRKSPVNSNRFFGKGSFRGRSSQDGNQSQTTAEARSEGSSPDDEEDEDARGQGLGASGTCAGAEEGSDDIDMLLADRHQARQVVSSAFHANSMTAHVHACFCK